jgi:DNA-binding NtrC family response regulator
MKKFRRYLITSALPYANGPLHIGHLAGVYVPSDIYTRYLRMKGEDVISVCGSDEHGVPIKTLTQDAIEFLKNQQWKGNIRELRNVIERAVILIKSTEINSGDLSRVIQVNGNDINIIDKPLRDARDDFERDYIVKLLAKFDWNITKTAEALEIDRAHLYRKMKELGIEEKK